MVVTVRVAGEVLLTVLLDVLVTPGATVELAVVAVLCVALEAVLWITILVILLAVGPILGIFLLLMKLMKGVLDFVVVVGVAALLAAGVSFMSVSVHGVGNAAGKLSVGSVFDAPAVVVTACDLLSEVRPADDAIRVVSVLGVAKALDAVVPGVPAEANFAAITLTLVSELSGIPCLTLVLTLVKAGVGVLEVGGEVLF